MKIFTAECPKGCMALHYTAKAYATKAVRDHYAETRHYAEIREIEES